MVYTVSRSHISPRSYDIDKQPFMRAYHEPLLQAIWYAKYSWRAHSSVELPNVAALLSSWLLRHVSLGEDLERYNYGIPQMPPDEVLLRARSPAGEMTREYVISGVRSHIEWLEATGNPLDASQIAQEFLCWMA
eukprot:gnl/TRDRNA2_/TRDRNA2_172722_c0_seq5.p1 gnl/TRDRNA2_/TRDRNA2_172722_c0~~gnl/TRDRNA2_/TRDRNA2_172722_c0_seq5.p1  ORF type:complete len:134 (-),score=18.46 gnl/TRDRNA2_/TRDRNA2_172722_c0_seq5:67-468(-)